MIKHLELWIGRKVNVFINNTLIPNISKNHVGILKEVYEDSIVVEPIQPSFTNYIILKKEIILVVLELKNQ